jgi:SAM-dependent methyltransferase
MGTSFVEPFRRLWEAGTLGLALQGEAGALLARLGDRLHAPSLTYNPWTLAIFHRAALEIAPTLADAVRTHLPEVESVADFGCGTGVYVAELRRVGVDAAGFEYLERARRWAAERSRIEVQAFDLRNFAGGDRTFDLAMSIEVAEHLQPPLAERLIDVCCEHAPTVLFTAAQPGQPGQGHINLQPRSHWAERFAERGYRPDPVRTEQVQDHLRADLKRGFWIVQNLGIYVADHETR